MAWSSAVVFSLCCGLSAAMFPAMFPLPQDDKAGKFAEMATEEFTNAFGNPFMGSAPSKEETDIYQSAMKQLSMMNPLTAFMAPWMEEEKEKKAEKESQAPKLVAAPAAAAPAQQLAAAPKVPEPQSHLPPAPPKDPGYIDRSIAKPPPEVPAEHPASQVAKTIAEGAAEQLTAVPSHAVSPKQLVPKSEVEAMQKDQKLIADDRKARELQEKIKMGAENVDAKKVADKLAAEAPASMGVQMNVAAERPAQPPGIADCNIAFGTKFMNITQHAQWTCNRVKMPEDGKIEFCGCGKVMYNIMRCDGEQPEIFDYKYKELVINSQDGCSANTCRYSKLPYDWYAGVPWLFYKAECSLATIVGGKNMVAHPEEDAKIVPVVLNPTPAPQGNTVANDGGK